MVLIMMALPTDGRRGRLEMQVGIRCPGFESISPQLPSSALLEKHFGDLGIAPVEVEIAEAPVERKLGKLTLKRLVLSSEQYALHQIFHR